MRKGLTITLQDAFTVLFISVLIAFVLYFMLGDIPKEMESERLLGETFEESADFYKALTAPCLTAEDSKNYPKKFMFDKEKLDKEVENKDNGISCLDIKDKGYAIKITDLDDPDNKWVIEYGTQSVDYNFIQMVIIKIKDEMHLGKFEFGVVK